MKNGKSRYYAIDPETNEFYRKPEHKRATEWRLTRDEAMKLSEFALIIALDERNFNESLNVYYRERLYKQLFWDERNGWIS